MKRKINFDVGIADNFDEIGKWPTSVGPLETANIDIEFDFLGGDIMTIAEKALKEHMMKWFPTKKYKIYYWTWLD